MAHIHKRNDKWAYIVNISNDPATGKQRQITKSGFRTKKEHYLQLNLKRQFKTVGLFRKQIFPLKSLRMNGLITMQLRLKEAAFELVR